MFKTFFVLSQKAGSDLNAKIEEDININNKSICEITQKLEEISVKQQETMMKFERKKQTKNDVYFWERINDH